MIFSTSLCGLWILVLVARWLASLRSQARAKSQGCQPVPRAASTLTSFLGIAVIFATLRKGLAGRLHEYLKGVLENAGGEEGIQLKTVSLALPGGNRLLTIDEANIHAILTHQNDKFNTGKRKKWFGPALGQHTIFGADGEEWKHSRAIIRSALTRDRISDTQVIHDNASHLIDKISAAAGEPLEVQELILAHTMRTSRQFLGIEEPNLSTTDTDFYAAYDSSRQGIMIRTALNNVYWLYNTRKFRLACQYTRNVANTSVRRVLAMPTSFQTEQSEKRNILEELVMHTRDPDRLSTMALDLLFAGRQTSASFVSSMLFYLARNPTIYAKLRQHVIQDFGKEATDDLIGFEDLKRCKYLQWCMNEALRLMPAVSFGTLTATEDVILPRGGGPQGKAPIFVSKGTNVIWDFYLLHRDPEYWGDDAEQYKPERFETRKGMKGYLPFNAGPRTCPGQQFALTSGAYTMVRICQRFKSLHDYNAPGKPRTTFSITQMHMDGVKIRVVEDDKLDVASSDDMRQSLLGV